MKKVLVSAILGLAAIVSVQAQSAIQLYTYTTVQDTANGGISYGAGSGGTLGTGVASGFTVGVYYAVGDVSAAANLAIGGGTTQGGANNDSLATSGLSLGTGTGATASLGGGNGPGQYNASFAYVIPGAPATGNPTVTLVLVAYNGASYETSTIRGHSAAFTMPANSSPTFAALTGNFASPFSVAVVVPEPSTFALAGLGLASLLIFRRRK